jgi:hypothetical protein
MSEIAFDPSTPRRRDAQIRAAELGVIVVALVGAWLLSLEALAGLLG